MGRERSAVGRRWVGLTATVAMIGIAAHAGAGRIGWSVETRAAAPWGVGDAAPEIPRRLGEPEGAGRPALMLFCCGCGVCRQVVGALGQAFRGEEGILLLGVYHGTAAQAQQFRQGPGARFAWIPDPLGQLHARWRVDQCPALFAVSPSGAIAGVEEPHSTEGVASAVARARQALAGG